MVESEKNISSNPTANAKELPKREKYSFDGKKLIPEILFIDAIIYQILNIQYIVIPLRIGAIFYDYWFLIFLFCLFSILSLVGAKYYRIMPVAMSLNSIMLLVGMGVFGYTIFFFNGPFDQTILALGLILLLLNGIAYVVNIRGQWKESFGSFLIASLIVLVIIAYLIFVYGTFIDIMVSVVALCLLLLL